MSKWRRFIYKAVDMQSRKLHHKVQNTERKGKHKLMQTWKEISLCLQRMITPFSVTLPMIPNSFMIPSQGLKEINDINSTNFNISFLARDTYKYHQFCHQTKSLSSHGKGYYRRQELICCGIFSLQNCGGMELTMAIWFAMCFSMAKGFGHETVFREARVRNWT